MHGYSRKSFKMLLWAMISLFMFQYHHAGGFIFVIIYIELSQIYKSIFKLNINYSNSHIVQDERKQIACESPLAWRRL